MGVCMSWCVEVGGLKCVAWCGQVEGAWWAESGRAGVGGVMG